MYQFFVEPGQIQGKRVTITGSDVNHIKNVLRMRIGEEIAVSNGMDGLEYRCGIEEFLEDEVVCTLRFVKEDGLELPSRIYLFQALPKGDKMELVIQKAVELGAFAVIPVAAKQSKRRIIPEVMPVMSMGEALRFASEMDVKLFPYELAEGMGKTKELIGKIRPGQSVAVFIGPEGGFEDGEVEEASACGFVPVTLGRRILRTETAGFTVLSWIMYQLEGDGPESSQLGQPGI